MSSSVEYSQPKNIFGRIVDYFDQRLNPILLKDIRSWLRSKLFLVLFFLGMAAVQIFTVITTIMAGDGGERYGHDLFTAICGGMGLIIGGLIPLLIQDKFSEEISSRSTELALASNLTPGQLVRGKIYSGLAAAAAFFAVVAPSLAIAFMIGGLSMEALFYVILVLGFLGVVANVLAVLIVAMSNKKRLRIASILFIGTGIGLCGLVVGLCEETQRGHIWADGKVWWVTIALGVAIASATAFFYSVAIMRLSPVASNRDTLPRILLWVCTLMPFLLFFFVAHITGTTRMYRDFQVPVGVSLSVFVFGALFLLSTPDGLSFRNKASWPVRRWVPRFTLFLQPGVGRLYAYLLFTFLVLAISAIFIDSNRYQARTFLGIISAAAFLGQVIILGNWVKRVSKRWNAESPRGALGLMASILFAILVLVTSAIFHAIFRYGYRDSNFITLLHPITAFSFGVDSNSVMVSAFLANGFVLAICVFCIWFPAIFKARREGRSIRKFHLAERAADDGS